jgi:hypothetical protein
MANTRQKAQRGSGSSRAFSGSEGKRRGTVTAEASAKDPDKMLDDLRSSLSVIT